MNKTPHYDELVYDVLEKWVNDNEPPPGNTYWISTKRWEDVTKERSPDGPVAHPFWIRLPMGIWVGPEERLHDEEIYRIRTASKNLKWHHDD